MRSRIVMLAALWVAVAWIGASAQTAFAIATGNAPIYLKPGEVTRGPLRTATKGTRFRVLSVETDWMQVEFRDPALGDRVGWVRRSLVRLEEASTPMDLSVPPTGSSAVPAPAPQPAPPSLPVGSGQRVYVEILDRRDSETTYSYVVPGSSRSSSDVSVNCSGLGVSSVNCRANESTTSTFTPARSHAYTVSGATFTLRLPDRRLVVVNCDSKPSFIVRRSCRAPIMGRVQAEFTGDNAKLFWPVSVDGQKYRSETYKILGIVEGR